MTRKQAQDAMFISDGACNPRGVARALVSSIDQDMAQGFGKDKTSPASFLILDQLLFLLTGHQMPVEIFDWFTARKDCQALAHEVCEECGKPDASVPRKDGAPRCVCWSCFQAIDARLMNKELDNN